MHNSWLTQQVILIGERDESQAKKIADILRQKGFRQLSVVHDGVSVNETLVRSLSSPPQVSLVIVSQELVGIDWNLLHATATGDHDDGVNVPVIAYGGSGARLTRQLRSVSRWDEGLGMTFIQRPDSWEDLVPLVQLSLTLYQERCVRRTQDAMLLEELAERRLMEARLKYLVAHDELTGLANRRTMEEKLHDLLAKPTATGRDGALLYLDLDRFNIINDLEGHSNGDRLLVEVVGLLRRCLNDTDIAARIGADEFCIFMDDVDQVQAVSVADQLRKELDGYRFVAGCDSYRISVSIGIFAISRQRDRDHHPSEIISHAHQACYVAKAHGRNRVHLYSETDFDVAARRGDVAWAPKLREALAENRFFLVFQPVVRLSDGLITHYEVLIRLRDDAGRVHGPGEFIPVAERMGMVIQIDRWVLENAIDFLCTLPEERDDVCLTLNLSGYSFNERNLPAIIQSKLTEAAIAPHRITFEITETATVANHRQCREMIEHIRALGCHFALDDFGAGFSSFDYVKKFPVDYLKIDGQFVQNLLDDETDQVLVKAMIEIARKLGKRTIAEFVDDSRVLALLHQLGVDFAQGYLLGRPEPSLLPFRSIPIHEIAVDGHKLSPLN